MSGLKTITKQKVVDISEQKPIAKICFLIFWTPWLPHPFVKHLTYQIVMHFDDLAQSRFLEKKKNFIVGCMRKHSCARTFSHLSRTSTAPLDALFPFAYSAGQ